MLRTVPNAITSATFSILDTTFTNSGSQKLHTPTCLARSDAGSGTFHLSRAAVHCSLFASLSTISSVSRAT